MSMAEEIGEIARENWGRIITYRELAERLGLSSPWAAGQQIGNAWRYFKRRGDTETCSAISRVFRSEED